MTGALGTAAVGLAAGVLSGCGVGGGSLLLLWLTVCVGLPQRTASGINLLYFLACAPPALVQHIKNGLIDRRAACWCITAGVPVSILASRLAGTLDAALLRRGFGLLLLWIGWKELFAKR